MTSIDRITKEQKHSPKIVSINNLTTVTTWSELYYFDLKAF